MSKNLLPSVEDLKKTDWKNPDLNFKDVKTIVLLTLPVIALIAVFLPWISVGFSVEDVGQVKIRAFGFATSCGILGLILSLISIAGVLYKKYSVTFCTSLAAVVIGVIAMNNFPSSKLGISFDDKTDREVFEAEMKAMDLGKSPTIKIPGAAVAVVSTAVEFIDQDIFFKAMKTAMAQQLPVSIPFDEDGLSFTNNRLGALLFLIFSILSMLASFVVIKFDDCLPCCNKCSQEYQNGDETMMV